MTANRVRTSLSTFYSWCIQRGHAELNPVIGTEKNKEQSRARVLTPAELRLIWNAAGDDDYGSIVKLLALTGQRENEIGSLCHSEIYDAEIILPEQRTKNGRPHVVPLSPRALRLSRPRTARRTRPDIWSRGGRVFRLVEIEGTARHQDHRANGGKLSRIDATRFEADLRDLFRRRLARHEFKRLPARDKEFAAGSLLPHVVEAVLNHVGATRPALRRFIMIDLREGEACRARTMGDASGVDRHQRGRKRDAAAAQGLTRTARSAIRNIPRRIESVSANFRRYRRSTNPGRANSLKKSLPGGSTTPNASRSGPSVATHEGAGDTRSFHP